MLILQLLITIFSFITNTRMSHFLYLYTVLIRYITIQSVLVLFSSLVVSAGDILVQEDKIIKIGITVLLLTDMSLLIG